MNYEIFNEDCLVTMKRLREQHKKIDLVLTSPPYNSNSGFHNGGGGCKNNNLKNRLYDEYTDNKTMQEYIDWTVKIFKNFNKILKKNRCVLYNINYGSFKPELLWLVLAEIIKKTKFTIIDCIIWKKKCACPIQSKNKLTRITEFVFVFCRKNEKDTFKTNKKIIHKQNKGQTFYETIDNFIVAKNSDGNRELNNATFSCDLCKKLLNIYARKDYVVYDCFNGTGTTGVTCKAMNLGYIGSEISAKQCELTKKRLKEILNTFG